MSGKKAGGLKAAQTNKKRDPDFYKRIGKIGGQNGGTGGFYYMKVNGMSDKIAEAGRKGGQISKRTKKVDSTDFSPTPQVQHHRTWSAILRRK